MSWNQEHSIYGLRVAHNDQHFKTVKTDLLRFSVAKWWTTFSLVTRSGLPMSKYVIVQVQLQMSVYVIVQVQ